MRSIANYIKLVTLRVRKMNIGLRPSVLSNLHPGLLLDPKGRRNTTIAATALAHGLTLVTRNTRDFERIAGLRLVNPWELKAEQP